LCFIYYVSPDRGEAQHLNEVCGTNGEDCKLGVHPFLYWLGFRFNTSNNGLPEPVQAVPTGNAHSKEARYRWRPAMHGLDLD
jgi:hypothetical protein